MTLFQKNSWICLAIFCVLNIFNLNHLWAAEKPDPGVKGKMMETTKDAKRGTKKGYRKIQDKTCEVINGKAKCFAKKVKHSMENEMDKVKDAAD